MILVPDPWGDLARLRYHEHRREAAAERLAARLPAERPARGARQRGRLSRKNRQQ